MIYKTPNGNGKKRVCYMDIKKFLGLMRWRIRFFFTILIFPSRYMWPYTSRVQSVRTDCI